MREQLKLKMLQAVADDNLKYFYELDKSLDYLTYLEEILLKFEKLYTIVKDKKDYLVELKLKGAKYDLNNYYSEVEKLSKRFYRLGPELTPVIDLLEIALNKVTIRD